MRKTVYGRIAIMAIIMLATSAFLFAQEVSITWNWSASQDGISAFRYQMDAEEENAWTVVDVSVTEYETGPVDATVPHVLYVQQSFDGENWSASGSIAFDPVEYAALLAVEPESEVEELATAEPVAEEVAEEPVVIATEEVAEEPVVIATEEVGEEPVVIATEEVGEEPVVIATEEVAEEPVVIATEEVAEEPVVIATEEVAEEPMVIATEEVAEEPVVIATEEVAEEPVVIATEEVAEEPVVAQPAPVVSVPSLPEVLPMLNAQRKGVELSVGLGGRASNLGIVQSVFGATFFDSANTYANLNTKILPAFAVDFVIDNLKPIGETMGIGLRAGAGYAAYTIGTTSIAVLDVHALAKFDWALSQKFAMEIGAGLAVVMPIADLTVASPYTFNSSNLNIFYGLNGQLNFRYNFTDAVSLGLQIDARFLFSDAFKPYELTGLARIGVGYRF